MNSLKLVIVGDSGVGKTSLARRISDDGSYDHSEPMTLGVDFYRASLTPSSRVCMWDTAGAERFQAITRSYYRSTDAAWFVFSDDPEHVEKWVDDFRVVNNDPVPLMLVRTKCDETRSTKPPQNIQELMLRLRIDHYLETSAKVQTKEELRREAMPFFVQALSNRRPRLVTVDLESNDYKDEERFTCC
tara:strand:- start:527 stop:1090 length:564 start_codon:yes stop_codon:yes gene_type:complete